MALFVKLPVPLLDTEEIAEASMAERGCAWTSELLAKRSESDGWFLRSKLRGEGADDALIDATIAAGLLEADGRRLRPVGWLERNPSQAALEARRVSKVLSGIRGNHERWHSGEFDHCGPCKAKVAEVVATCDTGAIADVVPSDGSPSQPIAESESDKDSAMRSLPTRVTDRPVGFEGPRPEGLDRAKSAVAGTQRDAGARA